MTVNDMRGTEYSAKKYQNKSPVYLSVFKKVLNEFTYAGHLLVLIHSKSNQNHSSVDVQTNSMIMSDISFIQKFNEQDVNIKKRLRLRM